MGGGFQEAVKYPQKIPLLTFGYPNAIMKKKNILLRGVPLSILKQIKKSAEENMRSINSEIVLILTEAIKKR